MSFPAERSSIATAYGRFARGTEPRGLDRAQSTPRGPLPPRRSKGAALAGDDKAPLQLPLQIRRALLNHADGRGIVRLLKLQIGALHTALFHRRQHLAPIDN